MSDYSSYLHHFKRIREPEKQKLTKHTNTKYGQRSEKKSDKTIPKIKEQERIDLVGSILTGMEKDKSKRKEWEGQVRLQDKTTVCSQTSTAFSTNTKKKEAPLANTVSTHSSYSLSFGGIKERVSRVKDKHLSHRLDTMKRETKYALSNLKKKNRERSRRNKDKTVNPKQRSYSESNHKGVGKHQDHAKFARYMNGVKSGSTWRGPQRIGSTRRNWRPDRAYDFDLNDMDVNDLRHPNDDFDMCRIWPVGRRHSY